MINSVTALKRSVPPIVAFTALVIVVSAGCLGCRPVSEPDKHTVIDSAKELAEPPPLNTATQVPVAKIAEDVTATVAKDVVNDTAVEEATVATSPEQMPQSAPESSSGISNDSQAKYVTSSGKPFVPKSYYPKWSWDTVREYKMLYSHRPLTDRQVRNIASLTDFICIEKSHAVGRFKCAMLGTKHEAARFKRVNPHIKTLFYFNSAYAWPFTSYTKAIPKWSEKKKHSILLKDHKTQRYAKFRNNYVFDILKPTMRTWWSDTVSTAVRTSRANGLFWDQTHGASWMRPKWQMSKIKPAHVTLLKMTKKKLGQDSILLVNNATDDFRYVANCDGVMYEHYGMDKRYKKNRSLFVKDWDQMLAVANAGKINIYRMPPLSFVPHNHPPVNQAYLNNRRKDSRYADNYTRKLIPFPLACFLMGAQPYSYFMYGLGWGLHDGALINFPETKKKLGPPKGRYQKMPKEGRMVFTRQFEHAKVWVNLNTFEAEIKWSDETTTSNRRGSK
ncbi:MAG: hypothetical protein HN341_15940 [Verrucomicrobia bacterium]|jgi:hypothetical protein|nr:hypothetical protein [Verrucomicrobiota bacterium]